MKVQAVINNLALIQNQLENNNYIKAYNSLKEVIEYLAEVK